MWRNQSLYNAIRAGDTAAAIRLLDQGADANAPDPSAPVITRRDLGNDWWGRGRRRHVVHRAATPLSSLLSKGLVINEDQRLVTALLDHGADPNARDQRGDPVLEIALKYQRDDSARLLIDRGANVNARGYNGSTALMFSNDDTGMTPLLLNRGADPDGADGAGFTALMLACAQDDYNKAGQLLNAGATVNGRNRQCHTALRIAVDRSQLPMVRLLLESGADPNIGDRYGVTPLMAPVLDWPQRHDTERASAVIDVLLAHGARKSLRDCNGFTAFDHVGPRRMPAVFAQRLKP